MNSTLRWATQRERQGQGTRGVGWSSKALTHGTEASPSLRGLLGMGHREAGRENGEAVVFCSLLPLATLHGGGEAGRPASWEWALVGPGEVMGHRTEVETSSGWAEQCADHKTAL